MNSRNIMGRNALATAALLALAGTAAAQTGPIQIYGTLDIGVGQREAPPPGGPAMNTVARVSGVHSGGVTTSFFGIRGTEDLGAGLKAKFQIESFMLVDGGSQGRFAGDPFWSRASWVGIEGGFGDIKLGNSTNPAWLAGVFSSAMGSNSLFSPTFRQQYNGSTARVIDIDLGTAMTNSVSYTTPRLGSVTATLALQAREGSGPSGVNYSANVVHRGGPLMLTAGASNSESTTEEQSLFVLGGSYDLKVVKLFAQYTAASKEVGGVDTDIKTPHLGLTAPLGEGQLQVAWAREKAEVSTGASSARTTTSLGYIYNLSRRTSLYGMFANDKLPAPVADTANSYNIGVSHSF